MTTQTFSIRRCPHCANSHSGLIIGDIRGLDAQGKAWTHYVVCPITKSTIRLKRPSKAADAWEIEQPLTTSSPEKTIHANEAVKAEQEACRRDVLIQLSAVACTPLEGYRNWEHAMSDLNRVLRRYKERAGRIDEPTSSPPYTFSKQRPQCGQTVDWRWPHTSEWTRSVYEGNQWDSCVLWKPVATSSSEKTEGLQSPFTKILAELRSQATATDDERIAAIVDEFWKPRDAVVPTEFNRHGLAAIIRKHFLRQPAVDYAAKIQDVIDFLRKEADETGDPAMAKHLRTWSNGMVNAKRIIEGKCSNVDFAVGVVPAAVDCRERTFSEENPPVGMVIEVRHPDFKPWRLVRYLAPEQFAQTTIWRPVTLPPSEPAVDCRWREPGEVPSEGLQSPFTKILAELQAMHDRKQADYGTDEDPLANVRASDEFGIEPWHGVFIRLNDKITRLKTFAKKRTLKNESVEDNLIDVAVYAIIALQLFRESQLAPHWDTAAGPEPKPPAQPPASDLMGAIDRLAEYAQFDVEIDAKELAVEIKSAVSDLQAERDKLLDEQCTLKQWQTAAREWLAKTEWVQNFEFEFSTIGIHRADVMKKEIYRLRELVKGLHPGPGTWVGDKKPDWPEGISRVELAAWLENQQRTLVPADREMGDLNVSIGWGGPDARRTVSVSTHYGRECLLRGYELAFEKLVKSALDKPEG